VNILGTVPRGVEAKRSQTQSSTGAPALTEVIRENKRLSSLLALRSQIVATGTHEARGALVAIRGYAKLLLERDGGVLSPTQEQHLQIILDNAQRLTGMLASLSSLANADDLELEDCDFREVWQEALNAAEPRMSAKSIQLQYNPPLKPLLIQADRDKLGLAFHKILTQTVQRTPVQGVIVTAAAAVEDQLRVSISSPQNTLQMGADLGGRKQGTESTLAEEIIRQHGGWFSSSEGGATSFSLPLKVPSEHPQFEDSSSSEELQ